MLTWARLLNGGINIFGWAISSLGLFSGDPAIIERL